MPKPKFQIGERVRVVYHFKGGAWAHLNKAIGVVKGAIEPVNDGVRVGVWTGQWTYKVDVGIVDDGHPDGVLKLMESSLESAENGIDRARRALRSHSK